MSFQQWDPTALPIRPGLYINFKEAAVAQITGGARGIVAIPLKSYTGGTAVAKTFYTIENEADAATLFGQANIQSIKLALQAGAKEVLVYTLPTMDGTTVTEAAAYSEARLAFEARPFNVFVFDGEVSATEQDNTLTWVEQNRAEKKHFFFVTGGSAADDTDPSIGNARSTRLADDYVGNLIVGGNVSGVEYSSGEYAAYIAGLIAGTAINRSITYTQVPLDDVNKRLRNSEIVTALQAGSLVLAHDGEKVKVEQGLTTSKKKIRKMRVRQAVATDLEKAAREFYIGKLDNNEDGQMALLNAFKAYLEVLETDNVLSDIYVGLSKEKPSVGDSVFPEVAFIEIDSMERILLTINV